MAFRLTKTDLEIMTSIAEFRVLPIQQLAVLHQRNTSALRRRLCCFEEQGLVHLDAEGFGRTRGRPERLVSLSDQGVNLLQTRKILGPDIGTDQVVAKSLWCLDHHLLVNTFRVQLVQLQRVVPDMRIQFLSPTSPFLKRSPDGQPLVYEKIPPEKDSDQWFEFNPDGVFAITDTSLGKTLLFFLEIDMGTETISSPSRLKQDVRQKILNYQAMLRFKRYKRYEKTWDSRFRGFRMLFLTYSPRHMAAVSRLVHEMQPSAFIWIADRGSFLSQGIWDTIWASGGRIELPGESILDSRKPDPSPAPFTRI